MNKTLLKSKNKKIVGGNKFTFNSYNSDDEKISFKAKKENDKTDVKLTFFQKNGETLKLQTSDIETKKNLKIITSNIATANYYEQDPEIKNDKKQELVDEINKFDTCLIVDFNKISYIFLNVNTSANKSIKEFEDNHTNFNLKKLDTLMMIKFKQLGLDINFVNKFMAAVKGYIDGQKNKIKEIIEQKAAVKIQAVTRGLAVRQDVANNKAADFLKNIELEGGVNNSNKLSKKINTNKILNNLILKLSKIHNVKKPTKPKTKATKPTKPKTKVTKPTKPKVTKPTKPKVTKPKATKKI